MRLVFCIRCYGILICSKYCKIKVWTDFYKKDCSVLVVFGEFRGSVGLGAFVVFGDIGIGLCGG